MHARMYCICRRMSNTNYSIIYLQLVTYVSILLANRRFSSIEMFKKDRSISRMNADVCQRISKSMNLTISSAEQS